MAEILIVDDDRDVVQVLTLVLELEGHRVLAATDGVQGLQALHGHRPDLVILDVEMPVMSGPDMALGMFLHDAGLEFVPILLISGASDLQAVADDVGTPYSLEKPVSLDRLLGMVNRVLAERRPPHPVLREAG